MNEGLIVELVTIFRSTVTKIFMRCGIGKWLYAELSNKSF